MSLSKLVRPSHVIEQADQAPAMSLSKQVRPSLAMDRGHRQFNCVLHGAGLTEQLVSGQITVCKATIVALYGL